MRLAFRTVRRAFKNSSLEHLGLFEEHLKLFGEHLKLFGEHLRIVR